MLIFLILVLVSLFLGLILLAARRIKRSETAGMIDQAICISAGATRRN
jgi:hypothetical protein